MTNRASAITVTVFSVLVIGGVIGYAVYATTKTSSTASVSQLKQVSGITNEDIGGSTLNVTSSSAVPLGGLPGDSGTSSQNQQATPNGSSNSSTQTKTSSRPTIDPKTFGEYEKYKPEKNSLFGDITVGSGTLVAKGTKVAVNYQGWLTNGTMFDQNTDASKPFTFTVGEGKVIPGFEEGVSGMKVGGERLVIIPPAAGYGATAQSTIPANSVLVFQIKIVAAL